MGADKPDPYYAILVIDLDNYPVFIALDIKDHSVAFQDTRRGIVCLDILWGIPDSLLRFVVPGF